MPKCDQCIARLEHAKKREDVAASVSADSAGRCWQKNDENPMKQSKEGASDISSFLLSLLPQFSLPFRVK